MKTDLFKLYAKHYYKRYIVQFIYIATIWYLNRGHNSYITDIIYVLLFAAYDYYHFGDRLANIKKLKAKGLTQQDLWNIEFVKKWEETRTEGLLKYCIRDGGIIAGAGFALLITLGIFTYNGGIMNIFDGPGSMFSFIAYTYMAGALVGVIIYRILWFYKERRFIRLTDPFNTIFASKNAAFNS